MDAIQRKKAFLAVDRAPRALWKIRKQTAQSFSWANLPRSSGCGGQLQLMGCSTKNAADKIVRGILRVYNTMEP